MGEGASPSLPPLELLAEAGGSTLRCPPYRAKGRRGLVRQGVAWRAEGKMVVEVGRSSELRENRWNGTKYPGRKMKVIEMEIKENTKLLSWGHCMGMSGVRTLQQHALNKNGPWCVIHMVTWQVSGWWPAGREADPGIVAHPKTVTANSWLDARRLLGGAEPQSHSAVESRPRAFARSHPTRKDTCACRAMVSTSSVILSGEWAHQSQRTVEMVSDGIVDLSASNRLCCRQSSEWHGASASSSWWKELDYTTSHLLPRDNSYR